MPHDKNVAQDNGKPSMFPETRWSLVLKMQGEHKTGAQRALGDLCQAYWYPLYGYARSRGLPPHDAEDSTQAFFQTLLARESLNLLAAERGRLRGFFLAAMKNYLATQWRNEKAIKRGGGAIHVSIDRDWAEGNLGSEIAGGGGSAENTFDRSWTYALLNTVSRRLEKYYDGKGKRELYEAIKGCLEGDGRFRVRPPRNAGWSRLQPLL